MFVRIDRRMVRGFFFGTADGSNAEFWIIHHGGVWWGWFGFLLVGDCFFTCTRGKSTLFNTIWENMCLERFPFASWPLSKSNRMEFEKCGLRVGVRALIFGW